MLSAGYLRKLQLLSRVQHVRRVSGVRANDMKRKRFIIAAAFFFVISVLWVCSYVAPYWLAYHRMGTLYLCAVESRGRVYLHIADPTYLDKGVRREIGNVLGWADSKPL